MRTSGQSGPLPHADHGYRVEPHSWEFGDVQVIWRDRDELRPTADPRDRGVGKVIDIPMESQVTE